MLKRGWTVRRAADPCTVSNMSKRDQKGSIPAIPVLVHRCNEERTLSAAAAHLARGTDGETCRIIYIQTNQQPSTPESAEYIPARPPDLSYRTTIMPYGAPLGLRG